jgi:hypothetical protein
MLADSTQCLPLAGSLLSLIHYTPCIHTKGVVVSEDENAWYQRDRHAHEKSSLYDFTSWSDNTHERNLPTTNLSNDECT